MTGLLNAQKYLGNRKGVYTSLAGTVMTQLKVCHINKCKILNKFVKEAKMQPRRKE
jgi:hypothetical protein